jgi:hypothetical protein
MRVAVLCLAAVACSSRSSAPAPRVSAADAGPAEVVLLAPPPAPPPFPPEVRSLRLKRSTVVKLAPDGESKNLGAVAQDTRVVAHAAVTGPGCEERWIEIEPRGWVCEHYLEPSTLAPRGVELPKLGRGERVPGSYGKITGAGARIVTLADGKVTPVRATPDSAMVRHYGETVVAGTSYWQIGKGEYVKASAIRPLPASDWQGVRLGDETGRALPIAFAVAKAHVLNRVAVYGDPGLTGRRRTLAPRALVSVLEEVGDGDARAVRIGDGEWLRGDEVRVVQAAPPPPGLLPGERWIDVDLDQQVLVAYEGDLPVYATLVSSGRKRNPTETGVYRVWVKFAETDMNGQMADEPSYAVATVPWTQFYAKDLALHTAYWHDRFGEPRSHGCVNLSPADARFLYFWSEPGVPPGWSMAHGVVERPGSLVRVRSAADPTPEARGYAARVLAARLAAPSVGGATVAP